ncbi:MAG: Crp/Fnr family transcriptional regulator [Flavobacteriales bacterium]|nr:Crp/Fnr family transcriptional regulator [Flavobacteriales bacterium]
MLEQLQKVFPSLDQNLMVEMVQNGSLKKLDKEEILFSAGHEVSDFPLVLSGSLRILREDGEGNEHYLYHIFAGETCAMSLTCCMSHRPSKVKIVAEDDSEIAIIPTFLMDSWMTKYPSWKSFVTRTYNFRFDDLLETIDSIAFSNMDQRLLKYLYDKSRAIASSTLPVTHQGIAYELNTTRVVISRLLKQLENKGLLKLGRNKIELEKGSLTKRFV